MTVADLIEALKCMPAHAPVLVEHVEFSLTDDPVVDGLPLTRAHACVTGIGMKHNHVILDATGGML
ncbi:hypothetical protein [Paraburkholderia sp.]|uniref:hypothetical protein n=1 Tax=Paraburkholderia sp. TaxID=1926495 RepID=UPI003D700A66